MFTYIDGERFKTHSSNSLAIKQKYKSCVVTYTHIHIIPPEVGESLLRLAWSRHQTPGLSKIQRDLVLKKKKKKGS